MKAVFCGKLIDGTGGPPLSKGRILINDEGWITQVDQSTEAAKQAEIINLQPYIVIPGIIDTHDHLCMDLGDLQTQANEPDQYHIIKGLRNARAMVHGGITTLRDVGEKHHNDVTLKEALNRSEFPGPRVVSCGELICRTGGHGWPIGAQVNGPDDVRRAVREQLKYGAQFIKAMISGGISTPGSDPIAQELSDEEIHVLIQESHRANRKVAAHIHGGSGARVAIEAGLDTLEHGTYLSREDFALMAEKGTYLIITHGVLEAAAVNQTLSARHRKDATVALEAYDERLRWARELGVKVSAGGDELHARPALEMRAMVQAGFTHMEALQAITRRGAEVIGISGETGTIEVGKRADLVAVGADPLVDAMAVENVRFVMRDGIEQFPQWLHV